MALKDGPLTPRQVRIIGLASGGLRQNEIARQLDVSYPVVRMEVQAIIHKFKAESSGQTYAMYARAEAYLSAAQLLEDARPLHPEDDDMDAHVWHVLDGIAETLRDRAAALLPK